MNCYGIKSALFIAVLAARVSDIHLPTPDKTIAPIHNKPLQCHRRFLQILHRPETKQAQQARLDVGQLYIGHAEHTWMGMGIG